MASFMQTAGGIHMVLVIDGVMSNLTVSKSEKYYEKLLTAIKEKATDEELNLIVNGDKLKLLEAISVTPNIELKGGQVFYQGEAVSNYCVGKMFSMIEEGFDVVPMANFLTRLMNNPSRRVFENLYSFLEKGNIAITEDGYFLAYRAVDRKYLDIHSGTVLNKPYVLMNDADKDAITKPCGKHNEARITIEDNLTVISMSRRNVDDDPDRTCSHGFHVASFDYLQYFKQNDGHILVCKIDPADVVAIPSDYNDTKMRVCRYAVLSELSDPNADKLRNASVMGSDVDLPFALVGVYAESGTENTFKTVATLRDAIDEFEAIDDYSTLYESVSIVNVKTGAIVDSKKVEPIDTSDSYDTDGGDDGDKVTIVRNTAKGTSVLGEYDSVEDAYAGIADIDLSLGEVQIIDENGFVCATIK